jgi:Zn-dependent protease
MPAPTQFDLNFRLFGIPVRVSPWFWIMALILGGEITPGRAVLWVAAVFFSILIHEFGHGLVAKAFGFRPQIALFGMGGLCASEADRQTPNQRLAVLLAGPGAQFVLLGLVALWGSAALGVSFEGALEQARWDLGLPPGNTLTALKKDAALELANPASLIYKDLLFINLLWPLLNLLPIWPLDGGQIAGELLAKINRRDGRRWGHIISMITASLVAFYLLHKMQGDLEGFRLLQILFFVGFAFVNYQILQAYHHQYMARGPDEDPDWWTRS